MRMWTDAELARLPVKNHVRQRGLEMTRLETFTDAAFAFAVTLLVISGDGIPGSYAELIHALKGTPAFAASFATIAAVWVGHRSWSRRYGLEDAATTLISLALIFVMLIYVYPLKMVFAALFAWLSGGGLPADFRLASWGELLGIFRIYGAGFVVLNLLMAGLYVRALRASDALRLDAAERRGTRGEIVSYLMLAATGAASVLWATLLPPPVAVYAGFVYATLSVSMPWIAVVQGRAVERLAAAREE